MTRWIRLRSATKSGQRRLPEVALLLLSLLVWEVLAAAQTASAYGIGPHEIFFNVVPDKQIDVLWPAEGEHCYLQLNVDGSGPLIRGLGTATTAARGINSPTAYDVDPVIYLTVGSRESPRGDSPLWPQYVFFDNPHKRSHRTFRSKLDPHDVQFTKDEHRATITIPGLTVGPFRGALEFHVYAGSPLVKIEAVVSTDEIKRAVAYDFGLLGIAESLPQTRHLNTEGNGQVKPLAKDAPDESLRVRHRILVGGGKDHGSLAVFPPPHQFFFPRDSTDNLAFLWRGANHAGFGDAAGIGIRQSATGGGNFVPWCNAPAGTKQRFGMFVLVHDGDAKSAYARALRYTRGDRFADLPDQTTFTSHYHMAITEQAMRRPASERDTLVPEFVDVFKRMNVGMVHLGEFHGDGHQKDPGPLRLPEMEVFFRECRRLSDDEVLFIPGEECNEWLGRAEPGKHPGHWMSLFARPVYWTQKRGPNDPWKTEDPKYGTVYHVGNRDDMTKLIAAEDALVWSAHPRIKASTWAPDAFREEAFYKDRSWLGAAWKAMPADLSEPRLGKRCLDLLDDMANWGDRKYLPGEVDVFKIDHTHELYGHMNINYLRLKKIPKFDDGWRPVLDALRTGAFFTTTGEVLITEFTVGGRRSGESWKRSSAEEKPELRVDLEWTFPLAFAEIISGDGKQTYRQRIDLSDTEEFGRRTLRLTPELRGRKWVRCEVWDAAVNGAYTQPVWLE